MTQSTGAGAALDSLYRRITAKKSDEKLIALVIYTVLFAVGYLTILMPIIRETGTILGGDGIAQYYPMLLSFRRTFAGFFENIANGSFEFPMMDVNNMYGTDTLGAVGMYAPFLPYYILTVLFPESFVDEMLMGGVIIFTFASGLSFMNLCRHFKKNMLWSGLFAACYAFCGNITSTVMWNPHFFVMTIAFPFIVIGIDNILHDKSGITLTLSIAWLCLSGSTFLVYVIPFAGVFALIRLIYVKKEKLLLNIPKYFGLGILSIIVGMLIAGIFIVPSFIALFTAERPLGGSGRSLLEFLIPSADYLKDALTAGCINTDRSVSAAVIPVFLYTFISAKAKGEHRCYSLVTLLLISLPLISFGTNGFMYDMCRWGFIPALYMCYVSVSELPEIIRTDRRDALLSAIGIAVFAALMYGGLMLAAGIFLAVCGLINSIPAIKEPVYKLIYRLYDRVFGDSENGRGLSGKIAAAVAILAAGVFAAVGFMQSLLPITVGLAGTLIIAVIASAKRNISASVLSVLCAVVFIASDRLYAGTASFAVYMITDTTVYDTLKSLYGEPDMFNRFHNHRCEAANYTDLTKDDDETVIRAPQQDSLLGVIDNVSVYSDPFADLGLRFSFPDTEGFSSVLNPYFSRLMTRCGQDIYSMYSPVYYTGFGGKEPLYSLFGISYTYSSLIDPMLRGVTRIDSPEGDDFYFTKMYKYAYSFPVGVTYDRLVSKDEFYSFSAAELPFAMMNTVWLDGYDETAAQPAPQLTRPVTFTLERTVDGKTEYGSEISHNTIHIDSDVSGCFLYLTMNGVKAPDDEKVFEKRADLYLDDIRKVALCVETGNWPWRRSCTSYTFSLGYVEGDIGTMTFDCDYDFDPDTLTVTAVPSEVFDSAYSARTEETLKNVTMKGNTVTGHIDTVSDKILSIGLLYSDGWKAYVDGAPAKLYRSNDVFLGLPLDAGSHDIRLEYSTPYIPEGAIVSAGGIAVTIIGEIIFRRRKKKIPEESK